MPNQRQGQLSRPVKMAKLSRFSDLIQKELAAELSCIEGWDTVYGWQIFARGAQLDEDEVQSRLVPLRAARAEAPTARRALSRTHSVYDPLYPESAGGLN